MNSWLKTGLEKTPKAMWKSFKDSGDPLKKPDPKAQYIPCLFMPIFWQPAIRETLKQQKSSMNNISFDLSGKIEPGYLDVISHVKQVADALGIPFFLVGATARDFILDYCYGIKTTRMTRDIDLGVEIANWDQFEALSKALHGTKQFSVTREKQRFLFNSIPVDIVPFGPIADRNKKI